MCAGCGGGSTGSDSAGQVYSGLTGSESAAEETRGTPPLPSTVSNNGEVAGNPSPSAGVGSASPETFGSTLSTDGATSGENNAGSGINLTSQIGTAKLVLREDFQERNASSPSILKLQGGTLIGATGVSAVHTAQNAWVEVNTGTHLSTRAGTLVIWVKPGWMMDDGSHPLVTLRWQDQRNGYLALTQGWWEPVGAQKLYFIVNNQDGMHCSAPYQLMPGTWNMVTAVWQSGQNGYCKLFVNGENLAEYQGPLTGDYFPVGPLYLGSELGANDPRNRSTNADFAALRLFDGPLSNAAIHDLFLQTAPTLGASTVVPPRLQTRNEMAYAPRRDADGTLRESRVIFDEDMHWALSPEHTDAILQRVKAAGFNVYVPCVYHGGGSWYPTTLLAPDPKLVERFKQNPDPLAYLIEKAHSMGIEVHPWFTVMYRGGDSNPQFAGEGTPAGAYNVHNAAFRTFIVNLMLDVVQRYDVDGINLDYIRAMGICTSSDCAADYNRKTGGTLMLDLNAQYVYGPARIRLEQWQDAAVKDIVSRVSIQAKQIKPHVVISIDGHATPPELARPLEGRNELDWAESGLVNVIFNMDYKRDVDVINAEKVRSVLSVPDRLMILFGNYDSRDDGIARSREGELVTAYVEYSQRKWPGSGMAFYIYWMLNDEQLQALRAGPFKEIARPYWPPR